MKLSVFFVTSLILAAAGFKFADDLPGPCFDGSNLVFCFVSPCLFASCPAHPDATCVENNCGGCSADWYLNGKWVDCDGDVKDPCALIACDVPDCPVGYIVNNAGPGCCPRCQLDCQLARCAWPNCPEGSEVVIPENQCCPQCSHVG